MQLPRYLILAGALFMIPTGAWAQSVERYDPAGAGLPLFRAQGAVAALAPGYPELARRAHGSPRPFGHIPFSPPFATDDTRGQLFDILESELGWMTFDSVPRFVGVPWTVGCGCAEEGWDEPVWVPPGDTVVFILSPTRMKAPLTGLPVVDVLGWHQPYPAGEFVPFWRWSRAEPKKWLTAREFFELLKVLPTETTFRLDPTSSLLAVEQWLRENPGVEEAFPIPTILRELGRLTAGR